MPAPSLRELQESFAHGLLEGGLGGPDPGLGGPDPGLGGPDPGLGGLAVRGGGRLSPGQALAVYREGYRARLTSALGEIFEALGSVLGDAAFLALCRDFIAAHPSVHYNLSAYGRAMGGFLAHRPETGRWPFLPELCAFEWTFHELFHLTEHAHAESGALSAAGPGQRLVIGGAAVLRRHAFSVSRVWAGRKERRPLPRAGWEAPERVLLYKRGGEIFLERLEEGEFFLLEALARSASLAEAVAQAAKADPEFDVDRVGALFTMIASSGIVERIEDGQD